MAAELENNTSNECSDSSTYRTLMITCKYVGAEAMPKSTAHAVADGEPVERLELRRRIQHGRTQHRGPVWMRHDVGGSANMPQPQVSDSLLASAQALSSCRRRQL